MKIMLITLLLFITSCATVVNNSNFDTPEEFTAPESKKSISITVFVKLYDEEGEFYGYGYDKELTSVFVQTFKKSRTFTSVAPLMSTCSQSYVCLDIPTSKKVKKQRHVNIVMPMTHPKKKFSTFTKVLNVITLGLFPAFYDMEVNWEVNMYNNKRELLYSDDTQYTGKTMSAVWLHYRDDKLASANSKAHYGELYKRLSKKILLNILFQLKRFPE